MIRFIHTADIHFGMENYGKTDAQTGIHSRLLDFKKALDFCIDHAITQKVDLFVFSGDAYKTANPSPTQQKLFMECMFRLYKANIPTVIVVGNHDHPLSYGKANALDVFAHLPLDGFYVFSKPELMTITTKSGPVQIIGMPWPNRHNLSVTNQYKQYGAHNITDMISEKMSSIVDHFTKQLDPDIPAILAGHLTVASGIFSGSEKRAVYSHDPLLMPSQLAKPPINYVALGHLHRFQDLNKKGDIPVVYAGSLERIDFGERKEAKGFCDVTIADNKATSYEFIPTPTRSMLQLDVTLNPDTCQTTQILDALSSHQLSGAIIKILYHVPEQSPDTVDIKKIQAYCKEAMYIVGIIPVRTMQVNKHRSFLPQDQDLDTLLQTYFTHNEATKHRTKHLLEKFRLLQQTHMENELDQKPT